MVNKNCVKDCESEDVSDSWGGKHCSANRSSAGDFQCDFLLVSLESQWKQMRLTGMSSVGGCDRVNGALVSDRSCPRPSDQSALVTSQGRRQQSFAKLANNPLFNKQTQNLLNFQSIFPLSHWRIVCKLGQNFFLHLVQNSPTFSSDSSPMRGRRLSKGSGGKRWEVGNLG